MSITKETQNFDSIDFSNLDEETETEDQFAAGSFPPEDHHNVDMDILQPHLSLPPPPSKSRRNPRERGVVTVDEGERGERTVHSSASVEQETDGDFTSTTHSKSVHKENENEAVHDKNSNHVTANQNGYHVENSTSGNVPSPSSSTDAGESNNDDSSANSSNNNTSNGQTPAAGSNPIQICYSKNTGNISVRETQVGTVGQDGTRYIATQQIPQQWDENERKPLRKKRIRWVKIFSIISCFLFFPTGIPAAYFAFRVEKEFEQGILRGNIDRAQKFATRSERLCILSVILCILVAALVVTLIERPKFQSEHYHRGTVTG